LEVLEQAHDTISSKDKNSSAKKYLRDMMYEEFARISLYSPVRMTKKKEMTRVHDGESTPSTRPIDSDHLGHELINETIAHAPSESSNSDISSNEDRHTPLSTTLSADGSDDSPELWLCTDEASEHTTADDSRTQLEEIQDKLSSLVESLQNMLLREKNSGVQTFAEILAGAGGARRGD
jgi:protein subunit release factor A